MTTTPMAPRADTRPEPTVPTRATPAASVVERGAAVRTARPRRYLMCPPVHFAVEYAINPWMRAGDLVDRDLAVAQWEDLRRTYTGLGHVVDVIDPVPGLPDMVFAANGGLVVDGRVMPARFRHAERVAEGPAYRDWFRRNGFDVADSPHANSSSTRASTTSTRRSPSSTGRRSPTTRRRSAPARSGRCAGSSRTRSSPVRPTPWSWGSTR